LIDDMPTQNPCVLIATPTRGSPKMQYMQSVIGTFRDLAKRGITSDFETLYGSDPAFQRDVLATRFLERAELSHIFFVDDDMAFPGELCARLLAADKAIVGPIAARRAFHPDRIDKALSQGASPKQAFLAAQDWIVVPAQAPDQPLVKVESLGFGAVLVRRDALELMIGKGAALKYPFNTQIFYGFFRVRPADAAEPPLSEDISFYRRWRLDCGGEVWATTDVPIMHIGDFAYGGRYGDLPQAPFGTR
jgi:hypothetical protein